MKWSVPIKKIRRGVKLYKCMGCGIKLQSEDEKKAGYVPDDVLIEKGNAICKRCFKIKNYGEHLPLTLSKEEYTKEVQSVLKKADALVFVVDIIELESSLDENIIKLIENKPIILAVNKIDIVPKQMNASKTALWIKERIAKYNFNLLDIAIVSNISKYGVNGIIRKLSYFNKKGSTVVVLGTTNVGKSSLINNFFAKNKYITVSKYPGTTLKYIKNKIPDTNITIIDTPGIIPDGRISDKVCAECNLKIVPSKKIVSKRIKFDKDRVLMFGGLFAMQNIGENELRPIIDVFGAVDVNLHETNIEKADEILAGNTSKFYTIPCENCKDEFYDNEFVENEFVIRPGEDFVIKGAGWVAVRRGPLKIKIKAPKDTGFSIRNSFIPAKY